MRRETTLALMVVLAACWAFLGASGASAADKAAAQVKGSATASSTLFTPLPNHLNTRKAHTGQVLVDKGAFLKSLEVTQGYCESGCCWASGCNVFCSETYCSASCGSNDTSTTACPAS